MLFYWKDDANHGCSHRCQVAIGFFGKDFEMYEIVVKGQSVLQGTTVIYDEPVINVDRVKHIPSDWMGMMAVPITFMDKWNPDQFELIDSIRPILSDGTAKYQRLLIRRKC